MGLQLIYNVVLVSVYSTDSVLHISILFQILLPFRLLQNIEFPVLHSRTLLVIYFECRSVYMSISSSKFIPPPTSLW